MKKANKLIKKIERHASCLNGLIALGFSEEQAQNVLNLRFGYIGFTDFSLQNNNAETNRLKNVLKALENHQEQQIESDLYKYEECKIENRLENLEDQAQREKLIDRLNWLKNTIKRENNVKDYYLIQLLNNGDAFINGYIQHPIKEKNIYAIVSYEGHDFVTFANNAMIKALPIHFIEFHQEPIKDLKDVCEDVKLLLDETSQFV
jgi:hypothetical protein